MTAVLRFLAAGFAIGLGLAGCSGSPQSEGRTTPQATALTEVADLLRATTGPGGRGPARLADLARLEPQYPRGYQAVKSGEIVVVWGAPMAGEGETGTDAVIAYEKKVPTDGGLVLLHNGTVKEMSADAFKSAPKAK